MNYDTLPYSKKFFQYYKVDYLLVSPVGCFNYAQNKQNLYQITNNNKKI